VLWLVMGLTGAVTVIARLTSRPLVQGLILGLGLAFIVEGVKLMEGDYLLAVVAMGLTFVLLSRSGSRRCSCCWPSARPWRSCESPPSAVSFVNSRCGSSYRPSRSARCWDDVVTGVVVLGLPQAALTLGNALVATVAEKNALFPDHRITVRAVAIDHGVMNLVGTSLGGVPMCHGAGGLAGH
jgi:hypothetical protein